jgi:hypothetical protein
MQGSVEYKCDSRQLFVPDFFLEVPSQNLSCVFPELEPAVSPWSAPLKPASDTSPTPASLSPKPIAPIHLHHTHRNPYTSAPPSSIPPICLKICRRPAATSPCSTAATCPFAASALPTTWSQWVPFAATVSTESDKVSGNRSEHCTRFGGIRRGNVKREPKRKRWNIEERTQEPRILTDNFSFSELAREKMWSRIHLIPVLQAEEDRDLVRRHWAQQAREKELMGAETKVYNNDRYATELRNRTSARDTDYRTDSSAPHTQSHPRRLRSRRGPSEAGRIKAKEQESHVVNIAGSGGVFPRRQPPADDSIKCSFKC